LSRVTGLHVHVPHASLSVLLSGSPVDRRNRNDHGARLDAVLSKGCGGQLAPPVPVVDGGQRMPIRFVLVNACGEIPDITDRHIDLQRIERPRGRRRPQAARITDPSSRPEELGQLGLRQRLTVEFPDRSPSSQRVLD